MDVGILAVLNCFSSKDPEAPSLKLADGTIVTADLIVAADGVHSGAAELILGHPNLPMPVKTFNWSYRFLIPVSVVEADPETRFFTEEDGTADVCRIWADEDARCRMISYRCRKYADSQFMLSPEQFRWADLVAS